MYSLLMSDCAERAVSDPCEGAATAAAGSAADTVTVSLMLATVSRNDSSPDLPSVSGTPFLCTTSKPGTATSTVYRPGASPEIVNCPLLFVVAVRRSLVASLRTSTAASTTTLPSGSSTTPLRVAPAAVCARSATGASSVQATRTAAAGTAKGHRAVLRT